MDREQMKALVTELHVRMDCNGCARRIKRALHKFDGIYEVYIDVAHQKLTVVGRVEPDKIVQAIKKTRKIATICTPVKAIAAPSSSETPQAKQAENNNKPSTEYTNQAPTEAIPTSDSSKDRQPVENQAPGVKPVPECNEAASSEPKDVEEIHMMNHHPHNHSYKERWNAYPRAPHCFIHSYNNYRPSPSNSDYICSRIASQRLEFYEDGDYLNQQSGDGSQITSIFSEENPNACVIV
ncbi:heavy metal-associated isoprenylated plant protein 5-like [Phalaenopsis equestris]|uniref:heavy metal-associated isoprenylated plant protein 5-like n=1 Tax=Phalaenopsis equestris TaxID=78828 RepID=UPI0009E301C7|nr:heavy metal-associated isoprenylated plant protein 5-like [Phalaenopsis equestris]